MDSNKISILKKIAEGPAVLFIGQSYLKKDSGNDIFLQKFLEKYSIQSSSPSYSDIFKIKENKESVLAWSYGLSNIISPPEWLEIEARVPWSHVYTSSIDTVVFNSLKTEWREIQPVYNKTFKIIDYRNKANLHLTYLFGCISQTELNKRPPLDKFEFNSREQEADSLRLRIPEILTPKGIFVIDGYDGNDWFSISKLHGLVNSLGHNQTHIFGASNNIKEDEYILDLISKEKITIHEESLASFLIWGKENGYFSFTKPEKSHYYGLNIKIGDKSIKIPDSLKTRVSRTAIIIEEKLFDINKNINSESKYLEFRNFLSYSSTIPKWSGYSFGFCFDRDFKENLKKQILQRFINFEIESPIIIHGQASSGKTICLGSIAHDLLKDQSESFKSAIIFIERSYKRFDENDLYNIDEYCHWAEDNGADRTIIIWDGMQNIDAYERALKTLTSRGRKVVFIGSSYLLKKNCDNDNFIEVPIELSDNEKKRFTEYIKLHIVDRPVLADIIKAQENKNFLAVLYNYLPDTKATISKLVREEAKYFSEILNHTTPRKSKIEGNTVFKDIFYNLGLITQSDLQNENIDSITIGDERASIAKQMINFIMVSGQFGLSIPFELLIRCLGADTYKTDFFNEIPNTDIIRWNEDHYGNISVGARTSLEAKIIVQSLGGKSTEIEYIKQLIKELSEYSSFIEEQDMGSLDIQFAVELLYHIKNENSDKNFKEYLYEISETLRELREKKNIIHPRLILQEAHCLRESIKQNLSIKENRIDALNRAEEIVKQSMLLVSNKKSQLYSFLLVELASILGTKSIEILKINNGEARVYYEEAKYQIIQTHALSVENYPALDVMLWTIRDLYKDRNTDSLYKAQLKAEALNLIQIAEEEKISDSHLLEFNEKKQQLGQLFKNEKLSQEAFDALLKNGSKIGYYLRAKEIMEGVEISDVTSVENITKCKAALEYLESYFKEINNDSQCLYLYLRLWWIVKNKKPLFFGEKNTISFKKADWDKCLSIINKLLFTSELYLIPSLKYLKGLAQFHLNHIDDSLATFSELANDSDYFSYGRRRIIISYISSDENGNPIVYNGNIANPASLSQKQDRTDLYVTEIRRKIKFFLRDFRKSYVQKDEQINSFHIGFNFIGPKAIPTYFLK